MSRKKYRPKAPRPCPCGCGELLRFGQGHQHRVYRPDGPNFHAPDWFKQRKERAS